MAARSLRADNELAVKISRKFRVAAGKAAYSRFRSYSIDFGRQTSTKFLARGRR